MFYRALIIVYPYGSYIAYGNKNLIVKSKKIDSLINQKLLLVENKKALGYIRLKKVYEINLTEFRSLFKHHLITEKDRKKWWKGKTILYAYPVEKIKIFKQPKHINYPIGPQISVKPENVKFI